MTAKFDLYGQSKLAGVVYASELSKHYPKITTAAIHPGVIYTGLIDHMGILKRILVKVYSSTLKHLNLQEGAYNTLWAATSADKSALKSGGVYEPVGSPSRSRNNLRIKLLQKSCGTGRRRSSQHIHRMLIQF